MSDLHSPKSSNASGDDPSSEDHQVLSDEHIENNDKSELSNKNDDQGSSESIEADDIDDRVHQIPIKKTKPHPKIINDVKIPLNDKIKINTDTNVVGDKSGCDGKTKKKHKSKTNSEIIDNDSSALNPINNNIKNDVNNKRKNDDEYENKKKLKKKSDTNKDGPSSSRSNNETEINVNEKRTEVNKKNKKKELEIKIGANKHACSTSKISNNNNRRPLKEIKQNIKLNNCSQNPNPINNNVVVGNFEAKQDTPLYKFLWKDNDLRDIILHYEKEGRFNKNQRNRLTRALLKIEINKKLQASDSDEFTDFNLKPQLYLDIGNTIVDTFPREKVVNFIVGYDKDEKTNESVSLGGRLFKHFHYVKRRMRQREVLERAVRQKTDEEPTIEIPRNIHDKLNKLQTNSEPWLVIKELWNETFETRQELLSQKIISSHQYFASFSCLHGANAIELIYEDYNRIYSEDTYLNFIKNWCASRQNFFNLLKSTKLKDLSHQTLIESLENSEPSDKWDAILFTLLPNIIKAYRPRKVANKVHFEVEANGGEKPPSKFSNSERIHSFIIHIKNVHQAKDLMPILKDLYNKYLSQPVVVLIGSLFSISGAFVVHDDNIFKANSCLEAVGICFKIYKVCQYKYSVSSYPFWIFIQRGLFKIESPLDEVSQNLRDLFMYIKESNSDDDSDD